MKYLIRRIEEDFSQYLIPNKVLILIGARRVGKTELLKNQLSKINESHLLPKW